MGVRPWGHFAVEDLQRSSGPMCPQYGTQSQFIALENNNDTVASCYTRRRSIDIARPTDVLQLTPRGEEERRQQQEQAAAAAGGGRQAASLDLTGPSARRIAVAAARAVEQQVRAAGGCGVGHGGRGGVKIPKLNRTDAMERGGHGARRAWSEEGMGRRAWSEEGMERGGHGAAGMGRRAWGGEHGAAGMGRVACCTAGACRRVCFDSQAKGPSVCRVAMSSRAQHRIPRPI